ncbi:TPA: hypothetical protein ACT4TI_002407 [Flavobacterium psychrophilum]|uniref:hypothetical protein n=1 Tax=Flavobacterium psychrophilum TaxID=96345 RepID=UPI000B7C1ECA|nr:hypothetical protein [Flavobacterium psychrophilum]GEJ39233.1 hypothetical protein FPN184_contig00095-0001 [Flavobacterium psychrophilum]SNB96762.1 conserved hypothetical protein [Flavobacterium psychrophilum]
MTKEQIQATGNFLTSYHNDLNYIKKFRDFKENKISENEYIEKKYGTFYSFLIEFRVARNFSQGMVDKLLEETYSFVNGKYPNDVDLFAENLAKSNLTRGKVMASMASKILFLNNPWEIIPMDTLARKTLNQKENKYKTYEKNLEIYREQNKTVIENCIIFTKPLTEIVNKEFENKIENLNKISENRIMDKLLWTIGK